MGPHSSHKTAIDPDASGDYPFDASGEDSRFQVHTGAVQSIAISAGREDAGPFAADHGNACYLPFEGSGASSDWNLKLTSAVPTFDWSTLTDVVLHVRYTARDGGELLRDAALNFLSTELAGLPLRRAFSARHEFPSEWNAFLHPAQDADEAVLQLDLAAKRFPYFARQGGLKIQELQLVALVKSPEAWTDTRVEVVPSPGDAPITLVSASTVYDGHPSATVTYSGSVDPGE